MQESVIPKISNPIWLTSDVGTLPEEIDFKGFTSAISIASGAIRWY
jgi:hypothetical protein